MVGCAFAQLPSTLTFSSGSAATTKIINITYDPGVVASGPLSGTGDLVFDLGGGNKFTNAAQTFAGIFADSSGAVNTGKAGYSFKKDIPWNNMFGSSMSATIKAPITVVVEISGSGRKVTLTADSQVQLPFRDESGNQALFSAKGSKLTLDGGANNVKFDTDLALTGAPKIQAAGFSIGMDSPHLTLQAPASPALKLNSATVKVGTPIPSIFTDGTVTLVAKNFAIDETGLPSFDSLTLSGDQAAIEGTPLTEEELANARVALLQPANFGLELTGVGGSVQKGKYHDLHLEGNLVFPDAIKNEDKPTEPGSLPITFDLSDPKFKRKGTGDVKLRWQPVSNGPTFHMDIQSFTLDMAKGLTNLTATVRIEGDDRFGAANGAKDVTLAAKGLTIDGNGLTGTISASPGLKVFGLTVEAGSLDFDRDTIVGGAFTGKLNVPTFGQIAFGIGISQNGGNVMVQASQGLSWPGIGKMNIAKGGGSIDKDHKVTLNLTGDVDLNILDKEVDLGFNDLQIDSDGHIAANELTLAKPVSISFYGLTLTANKMVYKTSPASLRIDGDVKFPDSLPITGDVGFEGLTITPGPKVSVGRVSFNASVSGVGTISGVFEGSGSHPDQGFKNTLEGAVSVKLDCLGGSGFDCKILMADGGAWLVGGNVDFSASPIILPVPPPPFPPYLEIYSIGLGLGHNIALRQGIEYDPNDPFKKYRYQDGGGFLIEGSVGFSTIDDFLAWGPLTLDVVTNPFQIALSGDFALLTLRGAQPYDANRSAHMVMGYFGDGFELHGDLALKLPLYELTGGVDAKFGKSQGYIYVGWPVKDRGITTTIGLKGVLAATSKEGIGLDLYPKFMLQAGLEESVKLFIVEGRRWINFGFSPSIASTKVHLDVGVEGKVDFYVATLSASAEASTDFEFGSKDGFHGNLSGRFTASIETFLGDVSVHAEGEVLSW